GGVFGGGERGGKRQHAGAEPDEYTPRRRRKRRREKHGNGFDRTDEPTPRQGGGVGGGKTVRQSHPRRDAGERGSNPGGGSARRQRGAADSVAIGHPRG